MALVVVAHVRDGKYLLLAVSCTTPIHTEYGTLMHAQNASFMAVKPAALMGSPLYSKFCIEVSGAWPLLPLSYEWKPKQFPALVGQFDGNQYFSFNRMCCVAAESTE